MEEKRQRSMQTYAVCVQTCARRWVHHQRYITMRRSACVFTCCPTVCLPACQILRTAIARPTPSLSCRPPDRNRGTIKLQGAVRMHTCRSLFIRRRLASIIVQCFYRTILAKRRFKNYHRILQATKIQALVRGRCARQEHIRLDTAATNIQSMVRCRMARREYIKEVQEAREQTKLENQLAGASSPRF